jgi:predicted DNA-binding antitoxin AbrB/MazE fold protein
MHRVVTATYQSGVLKPAQELRLPDQQRVLVIVLPLAQDTLPAAADLERVAVMKERANVWLSQQPATAVRPPLRLQQAQEQALENGFDAALAEIRAQVSRFSEAEIRADVEVALAEARSLNENERARLDAELEAIGACGGIFAVFGAVIFSQASLSQECAHH